MFDTNTPISQIMSRPVITVSTKDNMTVVRDVFSKNNIHHLPVMDEKHRLAGMISTSDYHKVLHSLTLFKSPQSEAYNDAVLKSLLTEDVMTRQIATLRTTDTIITAAAYFRENLFHAIPITDEKDRLVGIVSTFDLLSYAFKDSTA
jgi:CBS-domain-containing membrane protein